MSATALDPKSALIIIDLQKGILSFPSAHPIAGVVKNAGDLADVFRRYGLPVVLVHVVGVPPGRTDAGSNLGELPPDWAELVPELNRQPHDHVVAKRAWGAFTHTDLETYLKGLEVTQVVLAGVATSVGVESTARHAYELGFNVTLAVDAMTDIAAETHENSVARIFPKLGETGATREIIALLESRESAR